MEHKRVALMSCKALLTKFSLVLSLALTLAQPVKAEPQIVIFVGSSLDESVVTDKQLRALPQVSITTDTPWTEVPTEYEGPTLWSVLNTIGVTASNLEMVALNDYSIRLNSDRITQEWPIIARLQNGKTMSVREKGPYWLMFPFDDYEELQTETFYALSIWQLSQIKVLE